MDNCVQLELTPDEARAVQSVLRDYAAQRWSEDGPEIEICKQVQGWIREQLKTIAAASSSAQK